ncbi:MAG: hypothetical protein H6720_27280 [Sandaracinus sp.]|nr:hypothetical protein [Myxococcales bacterium]MCB9604041.1 hypothetical protein [Sandaracinus sp.]
MERATSIRHILLLLVAALVAGGPAAAQAPTVDAPTGTANDGVSDPEVEPEATTVDEADVQPTPEAEPVAAPVEPVAEPVVEPVEATEEEEESLLPPGEEERMGTHAVDLERLRFVPGKGLEINSADGAFRLRTRVRVQFRYTAEGEDGDWQHQFHLRRARLVFDGHAFTDDITFKLELAVSPADSGMRDNFSDTSPRFTPLLDFYVELRQLRDLTVRVGQYKVPGNRQRVISSGDLQLVDRSLLNNEFNIDRDVGVDLRSRDFLGLGFLRYYAGVFMARGRDSHGFDDFGMMYLARVEVLPLGMFDDYQEADFDRAGPRLSLGLGGAYIDRARRDRGILGRAPADGGTTDTAHLFADAVFMAYGLSVTTELAYRHGTRNPGDAVDEMGMNVPVAAPRNGYGMHLQAGYLIPRLPVEVAARYGFVRGTGSNTALGDDNELVLGVSYYFAHHPLKLQADYGHEWSDEFSNGSHALRMQLQVSL